MLEPVGPRAFEAPLKLIDGAMARARACKLPTELRQAQKALAEMRKMSHRGLCLPKYSAIDRSHNAAGSATDLAPLCRPGGEFRRAEGKLFGAYPESKGRVGR